MKDVSCNFSKRDLRELYACVSFRLFCIDELFLNDLFVSVTDSTEDSLKKERDRLTDLQKSIVKFLIYGD